MVYVGIAMKGWPVDAGQAILRAAHDKRISDARVLIDTRAFFMTRATPPTQPDTRLSCGVARVGPRPAPLISSSPCHIHFFFVPRRCWQGLA